MCLYRDLVESSESDRNFVGFDDDRDYVSLCLILYWICINMFVLYLYNLNKLYIN